MKISMDHVGDPPLIDAQRADVLLKVLSGVHRGAEIRLREGTTTVGRAIENDVILMDLDVAQCHFEIQVARGEVTLRLSDEAVNIWIDGRCLSQREFVVPVLTPVYIGNLLVVFGDENADWFCDFAADNVVERQITSVEEPNMKVSEASSQNFGRLIAVFVAGCSVIIVAIIIALALFVGDAPAKNQIPKFDPVEIAELEQFFIAQEMSQLQVNTSGDIPKITGRLGTNQQLHRLEQFVNGRSKIFLVEILVDEDLAQRLVLSLKHQGESKLDIRRGATPGSFIVHGIYENIQLWPRLRDQLLAEVAGVEMLMSDLYTRASVLEWLKQELNEARIVMTATIKNDDSISLSGEISEDRQQDWQRIKMTFGQRFGRHFRLEHVPQNTHQKTIRLRSISAGTVPYVVTLEGASVLIGGVLEGGYKVVSIREDEVLASNQGKIERLQVEVVGAQ